MATMKALGVLTTALVAGVICAESIEFPSTYGQMTQITDLDDADGDGQVTVRFPVSRSGELVTLVRIDDTIYIPIGRSYDGNDWESVAGIEDTLVYDCEEEILSHQCTVTLPYSEDYYLTVFNHTLTHRAEAARFLERATFGPTTAEIDQLASSADISSASTNWVKQQMTGKGISSHREFFRKRLNPRSIESYKYGISGPGACDENSRWRTFAFTRKDWYLSYVEQRFNLTIEEVPSFANTSEVGYVLKFADHIRTVVTEPLRYWVDLSQGINGTLEGELEPGSYRICLLEEIEGWHRDDSSSPVTFGVEIEDSAHCRIIDGGNPFVYLDSRFIDLDSTLLLDLTNMSDVSDIVAVNTEITKGSEFLLKTTLDMPECDEIPNPYDNDFRGFDKNHPAESSSLPYGNRTASKFDQDAPVFAILPTGQYAIHDYRLLLQGNTIENPFPDGGGAAVLSAQPEGTDEMVTFCSNAPMTIFNEDNCFLSFEETACLPHGVGNGESNGNYTTQFSFPEDGVSGVVVCGSQGEVAPDPNMDNSFDIQNGYLDSQVEKYTHKRVWFELALGAPDQLRQRVAWALSQIFAVTPDLIAGSNMKESYLHFYDIFVRNAFGNYRDIVREMAYSPRMGESLTYVWSRAAHVKWHSSWNRDENNKDKRLKLFPDENFARELFQLFTIGLEKLNMNGTRQLDRFGNPIKTFDTKDIVSFARSWTGFRYSARRGNYEEIDDASDSRLDPMDLVDSWSWRDYLPKRGLNGQYIGDKYPLCYDLPRKPFLREGAKFRLLGGTLRGRHRWLQAVHPWVHDYIESLDEFIELNSTSGLYDTLCQDDGNDCTYPPTVTLTSNLVCSESECDVDTVRIVKVNDIFYEFLRQPCIQQIFYEGAKKVIGDSDYAQVMCAHPKMAVATEVCCDIQGLELSPDYGVRPCSYLGERSSYEANIDSCAALGGYTCDPARLTLEWHDTGSISSDCQIERNVDNRTHGWNVWHWTNTSCSIQAKVLGNGLLAVVHDAEKTRKRRGKGTYPETAHYVNANETFSYFSVHWQRNSTGDEQYPSIANDCGFGTCERLADDSCLCNTTVDDSPVFSALPSAQEALDELQYGAFPPSLYDDSSYEIIASSDEVIAYGIVGILSFSQETIFELVDPYDSSKKIYLKNMKSEATIGDGYTIRNPPHFMDLVDPEARDAYYETDAVIDHSVRNDNTPPFVARLLIQHFGISNPSPRFIEVVATAFKTGQFTANSVTFGSGVWGDMAATVAAILLDREASNPLLDADPTFGSIREPLNKVVGMMRSLELQKTDLFRNDMPFFRNGIGEVIGQMPYEMKTVFSFFSPLHSPPGQMSRSGLLAPEAEALTLKTSILTLNGMYSLIRNGLLNCDFGFGPTMYSGHTLARYRCRRRSDNAYLPSNWTDNSYALLGYSTEDVAGIDPSIGFETVSELATLLTAGRLSPENLALITEEYDKNYAQFGDAAVALKVALQMIVTAPEFHTTNLVAPSEQEREPTQQSGTNSEPYKAIVYIHLLGGYDSFYMLSPHATDCSDLYEEYLTVRGEDAAALLEDDMLKINATGSEQACDFFGLNKNIPIMKEIYDAGHGLFFANTGHLTKPVTKYNYFTETKTQLFSHSSMELEANYVDALREHVGTGVLGRMLDVLEQDGYSVAPFGINNDAPILAGNPSLARSVDVVNGGGVAKFYPTERLNGNADLSSDVLKRLHNVTSSTSGLFADLFSQRLINAAQKSDELMDAIPSDAALNQTYNEKEDWGFSSTLRMVSKLILSSEERGANRDAFSVKMGGWDSHSSVKSSLDSYKFPQLAEAIKDFYREMQTSGMLENVTVVIGSEFGRTLTPNSGRGTDHAWGGNYFVFGGGLKGGRVLGEYPQGFTESDPTNDGRGRLIPTTSWDAIWNGVAQWYGISSEDDLDYVLPNRGNFGCRLYTDKDMYVQGQNTIAGCSGDSLLFEQSLSLSQPRYLESQEQKDYCDLIVEYASVSLSDEPVRCVVVEQHVEQISNDPVEFGVSVKVELSSDAEDFGFLAAEALSDLADTIGQRVIDEAIVSDMMGLSQTVLITPAPSVSMQPSAVPSTSPSIQPSLGPSGSPSVSPSKSLAPSFEPSLRPSSSPSRFPSLGPSETRSLAPSLSSHPSRAPSELPSAIPSGIPSLAPTLNPTTVDLSAVPSNEPSGAPHSQLIPGTEVANFSLLLRGIKRRMPRSDVNQMRKIVCSELLKELEPIGVTDTSCRLLRQQVSKQNLLVRLQISADYKCLPTACQFINTGGLGPNLTRMGKNKKKMKTLKKKLRKPKALKKTKSVAITSIISLPII